MSKVDRAERFAINRLLRVGDVKAKEISSSVSCSLPIAGNAMTSILNRYGREKDGRINLLRMGGGLRMLNKPSSLRDPGFNGLDLLDAFADKVGSDSGIIGSDIPMSIHLTRRTAIRAEVANTVVDFFIQAYRCDKKGLILSLRYVSMNIGESARWRRLYPVRLVLAGHKWLILAHDLEADCWPIKTYLLSRALDAAIEAGELPAGLKLKPHQYDEERRIEVDLNPSLTDDQRAVIRAELSIDEANMMPTGGVEPFEILRRYGNEKVSQRAVWPILFLADGQ